MKGKVVAAFVIIFAAYWLFNAGINSVQQKTQSINAQIAQYQEKIRSLARSIEVYRRVAEYGVIPHSVPRIDQSVDAVWHLLRVVDKGVFGEQLLYAYPTAKKRDLAHTAAPVSFIQTTRVVQVPLQIRATVGSYEFLPTATFLSLLRFLYRYRTLIHVKEVQYKGNSITVKAYVLGRR